MIRMPSLLLPAKRLAAVWIIRIRITPINGELMPGGDSLQQIWKTLIQNISGKDAKKASAILVFWREVLGFGFRISNLWWLLVIRRGFAKLVS